jgi:hypothetical protein
MPELLNFAPFPNFRYYSSDARGAEFGVVIVKGTFQLDADGALVIAEEQAPFMFTDACHGEVNVSSLWHPSDLVPNKPRCDVIVNAVARTADGKARPSWICGVEIARRNDEGGETILVQKVLAVTGPREWRPRWSRALSDEETANWRDHRDAFERWELSAPEPIAELPLRYEIAFGGLLERGRDEKGAPIIDDIDENPIGRGWIDAEWTDHTKAQPAPQIELYGDPIVDPYRLYAPHGLGPIPCAWEPRLPLAGTYDQNWIDAIWPDWPPDYDFAYHNSAASGLVAPGHLVGDETVKLLGLSKGRERVAFSLPSLGMTADFVAGDGTIDSRPMRLDTLFLEIAEEDPADWRVLLSWRINFEPDAFAQVGLRVTPVGAAADGAFDDEIDAPREEHAA